MNRKLVHSCCLWEACTRASDNFRVKLDALLSSGINV